MPLAVHAVPGHFITMYTYAIGARLISPLAVNRPLRDSAAHCAVLQARPRLVFELDTIIIYAYT